MLRTNRRVSRSVLTAEGEIVLKRYVLRPKSEEDKQRMLETEGISCIYPLDIALGIDRLPFKMTPGLMLRIAGVAAQVPSYERTESILKDMCNVELSDDTIRSVTNYVGGIVFQDNCRKSAEARASYEGGRLRFTYDKDGVLYMSVDGATLNTRAKGDGGSTWRENKLAMAYSSDDIETYKDASGDTCHRINKREYATFIGSVDEFKWHWLSVAVDAGYGKYKEAVVLSDGAPWIRNVHAELFSDAQRILDLFHLKENTGDYFKALFPKETQAEERKQWSDRVCAELEAGRWKDVLKELKAFKRRKLPPHVVDLPKYIEDNQDAIDYPTYKEKGYVVGSGSIESSNKTVLQSRMKQAGMRWAVEQGQGMVALKARQESGKWNSVETLLYKHLGIEQ